MQTFLPYADFNKSAEVLDNRRLNKQILEGYQILKVLGNPDPRAGWRNHPAVKMWRGHEFSLFGYVMTMVDEAKTRGIKTDKNEENLWNLHADRFPDWGMGAPEWWGDEDKMSRIVTTHKANLYKKDPLYYYDFIDAVSDADNKPCCDTCQYYWVTHEAA
jgi:hypothetical protein